MKTSEAAGLVVGAVGAAATVAWVVIYAKGGGGGTYNVAVGVVRSVSSGGGPVVGAVVSLGSATQVTDNMGEVLFAGTTAGSYSLSVTALGYNSVFETVVVSSTAYSFQVTMNPLGTCTPKNCPCGQTNDLNCNCVPQQLATMFSPPSMIFDQNWYGHINVGPLGNTILCAGTTPGGDPGNCGTCGPTSNGAIVQVTVDDVNGNPACGVNIQGFLSEPTIPWRTSDGQTWGHFALSLSPSVATTDGFGVAMFTVNYTIVVDGTSGYPGICFDGHCGTPACGPSTTSPQNYLVSFSAQVQSSSLRTITSVAMHSVVYVYYYA